MSQHTTPAAETPEVSPAMTSQRPHPRRTAPTGGRFPPATLRRQDAQALLPEDFVYEARWQPLPFPNGVQEDEPDSSPTNQTRQSISRGDNSSRAPTPPQARWANFPPRTQIREVTGSSSPTDEDIERNVEIVQRRLRAGIITPVRRPLQRAQTRPLLFQENPSRQSRRHPRGPSLVPHSSRRTRFTLPSDGPEPEPLRNSPQADPFRPPPPPYSPRNPRLHPTSTDYELTSNVYGRPHNNGAPPLPLYTAIADPSERVLQFGGSEDEQRNALVRLREERGRQQPDERLPGREEIGHNGIEGWQCVRNAVAELDVEDAELEADIIRLFMDDRFP
ncbi:hypothetical protein GE21DRAFT_4987 [Neurospora crassa]|uniref:Uncharacterized protein n=1 Tax=Neurospora crassa (strain ATCC 24698 / 74-OR23-1A / CBS 708.71 / DSM 1257 / FGSC 987) TaxID=367110 RepID=Q7RV06_NEUCR|nr:hypothetical protein NCU08206 [Neurospora crassa OR74A]pir/T49750/ related to DNA-directed RNA polymerase II largest chain [imported] - Neurospora crassa [Neurospora crassa]EAA30060.1 hypothetical protein NCU08206 [Neurospora crassa OR74A]KHE86452.1 hypothetical protein GE21DRAFT_4987 [Neurospora crassa]|eukprot:XP_959296.1 hypothetical protein NCU08206 [Neurospora crassa OR74A]